MKDLKVIFMGTPEFCVPILKALIENCNVIAVVTQPDKKVGRHQEISYSPIKKVAIENNIKVFQPIKIKEEYELILRDIKEKCTTESNFIFKQSNDICNYI